MSVTYSGLFWFLVLGALPKAIKCVVASNWKAGLTKGFWLMSKLYDGSVGI